MLPRPSSPCIDTPLASRDLECTSVAIPPMLPSPRSDSDSANIDTSASSDTSLTCSRHDHDTTDPETELCDIEQRRRLRDVTLFYKNQTWTSRYHLATCADPCRLPNSMSEHQQATSSDILMPHLPVFVLRPLCTTLEPPTSVCNRCPDSSTVPDGRLPNHQSPVMLHVGF